MLDMKKYALLLGIFAILFAGLLGCGADSGGIDGGGDDDNGDGDNGDDDDPVSMEYFARGYLEDGETTEQSFEEVLEIGDDIIVIGTHGPAGATTDILVARLNAEGEFQEAQTYGGDGDERAFAAAEDTSGNIVIVGDSDSDLDTGEGSILAPFAMQINPSDLSVNWARKFDGPDIDEGSFQNLDASGSDQLLAVGGVDLSGDNVIHSTVMQMNNSGEFQEGRALYSVANGAGEAQIATAITQPLQTQQGIFRVLVGREEATGTSVGRATFKAIPEPLSNFNSSGAIEFYRKVNFGTQSLIRETLPGLQTVTGTGEALVNGNSVGFAMQIATSNNGAKTWDVTFNDTDSSETFVAPMGIAQSAQAGGGIQIAGFGQLSATGNQDAFLLSMDGNGNGNINFFKGYGVDDGTEGETGNDLIVSPTQDRYYIPGSTDASNIGDTSSSNMAGTLLAPRLSDGVLHQQGDAPQSNPIQQQNNLQDTFDVNTGQVQMSNVNPPDLTELTDVAGSNGSEVSDALTINSITLVDPIWSQPSLTQ